VKRLLLALGILGTLIIAGNPPAAQAFSPTWPGRDYARVKLWTGADCGANSGCQFITRDNVTSQTRIVSVGSLTTNGPQAGGNCTWLYIYPSQSYACYAGFYFVSNAWTDYWSVYEGDSITAYARQPCPTAGAYHYSELKPFYQPHDPSGIAAEWLGTLTIQSGCQTTMAPLG